MKETKERNEAVLSLRRRGQSVCVRETKTKWKVLEYKKRNLKLK